LPLQRSSALLDHHLNDLTQFLQPIQAHNPNGILIGSAVFAQMTAQCPYTLHPVSHTPAYVEKQWMFGAYNGLSRYRSGPRHQHHHYMNDILCRAIKWAQIPAVKEEPMSLLQQDGITLLPRARGKPMAWDVTVLVDTYAKLHISHRAGEAAAAANRASASKTAKYGALPVSHIFLCSCYGRDGRHMGPAGH